MATVPTEKAFYTTIRNKAAQIFKTGRYKLERVESGVSSGVPDVHGIIQYGYPFWMELKTVREPANDSTLLFGTRARGLTIEQENWILSYSNLGGECYVAICTDKSILLYEGARCMDLNTKNLSYIKNAALYSCDRGEVDWEDFFSCF